MRLRRPCVHGRYDPHVTPWVRGDRQAGDPGIYDDCPGGEFLPDDALVLVYEDLDPELVMDLVLDFLDRDDVT